MKLLRYLQAFIGCLLVSFLFSLNGGKTSESLNHAYQDTSKELILLRKDHPAFQSRIYPLLDKVGSLYRISMDAIKKKKQMKQMLGEERRAVLAMRSERDGLRGELHSLREDAKEKVAELEQHKQQLAVLAGEKEELQKKQSELDVKMRQIEAEEKSTEKAVPQQSVSVLSKNSDEVPQAVTLGEKTSNNA